MATKTLSQAQLAESLSKKRGYSKKESEAIIERLVAELVSQLEQGNVLEIEGVGYLSFEKQNTYAVRRPKIRILMNSPARGQVRFATAKDLKQSHNPPKTIREILPPLQKGNLDSKALKRIAKSLHAQHVKNSLTY